MKITKIIASAGVTFNHPYIQFSNFRPAITLEATLGDHEDATASAMRLLAQARACVDVERENILDECKKIHDISQAEDRIRYLTREIASINEDIAREEKNVLARELELEERKEGMPAAVVVEQFQHAVDYAKANLEQAKRTLAETEKQLVQVKTILADLTTPVVKS